MQTPPDEMSGPGDRRKPEPKRVLDVRKILTEDEELSLEEELVYHLTSAQQHAQEALNICYGTWNDDRRVKRSMWYRMVLGRAQSILMSLLVRELRS
jgi:hypothetical protein